MSGNKPLGQPLNLIQCSRDNHVLGLNTWYDITWYDITWYTGECKGSTPLVLNILTESITSCLSKNSNYTWLSFRIGDMIVITDYMVAAIRQWLYDSEH